MGARNGRKLKVVESEPATLSGNAMEGHVVRVNRGAMAVFESTDGLQQTVRIPRHVDRRWLAAAVAIEPVPAIVACPNGVSAPVLWCVFAEAAHEALDQQLEIQAETIDLTATKSLRLLSGKSIVTIAANGDVNISGRNIVSRGSNVNWVRGGAVHLN